MDTQSIEMKRPPQATSNEGALGEARHTTRDESEMARYGKKPQLKRDFGWMSITGLTCTVMLTWEGSVISFGPQLINGGPAGAFGGFIFAWIGTLLQTLVMAELASAIPLSGGQYNWIAILAPPAYSKFLSYISGWVTLIAWQAAAASILFLCASMIQSLAVINNPAYVPKRWQVTLIMYGLISLGLFINTYLGRHLTKFEAMILVLHIFGFFVVLIVLVHLTPVKVSASEVFGSFVNAGGWSTSGLSFMVGLIGSIYSFGGVDGAAHLAEETKNASTVVPASMLATVLINGSTGLGMILAMLFCMGDVNSVVETYVDGGLPFAPIFTGATGSASGAVGLSAIPTLVAICGGIGAQATASRMIWAFARENALPGSKWLAKVHPKTALPLNAIILTGTINFLLALIEIGSTAAFNALAGLLVQGFYSTYLIAASVSLHNRLTTPKESMLRGPFHMGVLGIPVTILALVYTIIGFFFSFWPSEVHPTVLAFNWAIVVYICVVILAISYWFIRARAYYKGPLRET